MVRFVHECARDGFSEKIVGHATMAREKKYMHKYTVFMIAFFICKDNVFSIF